MEKKSSGYQTGIASEHLVLSMLYRLGAKAYLTLGNEKSIDIRITKDDGSWISVDVKSVRKGNAIPVGNAVDKDNHYYVFVIYGEFYQFNLSSCIRQQNSLTAQFVSFSLANLANIFYPPDFYNN